MSNEVFTPSLESGERVLWTGRPAQGLLLTWRDRILIPFSFVWCGVAIYGMRASIQNGDPTVSVLVLAAFLIVGLYILIGRFAFDAFVRSGQRYAVTNKRILIDRRPPFAHAVSFRLADLSDVSVAEESRGRGTICIGSEGLWGPGSIGVLHPSLDPIAQFIGIDDARTVYELIRKTALENKAAA